MLKKYRHAPAHLFLNNTPYFITGAIYLKKHLLQASATKSMLLETIRHIFNRYRWELHHQVILHNHYHLMGKSRNGKDLSKIIRSIHSISAIEIRKVTEYDLNVWWNYWDYCPRDVVDYYNHLNYMFYNPIKHGLVKNLREYPFSSFIELYENVGREKLALQFSEYPDYRTMALDRSEQDNF